MGIQFMITTSDVTYGLCELKDKQKEYQLYHEYYEGEQRLAFATDSFRNAFGYLFKEFSYNRCAAVVDAYSDRLNITGWETDKNVQNETSLEKAAVDIWRRNRMDKRQGEVHTEALRSGDCYLTVWPDPVTQLARMTPSAGHLMTVVYDDEFNETIAFAVRSWKEDRGPNKGRWRVTVYEPEMISRYVSKTKMTDMPAKWDALVPYEDDGNPEIANPYGKVPVFHFANNADTGDDGHSELADIVPLQDALNKVLMDGLIAGEFLGFPQRIIAGLEPNINPVTGLAEKPFDVAKDRIIMLGDAASKWGQFDPADMGQFSAMQNEFDLKIARVSRVPVHWINQTGDFPSGEALKTAEGPFVGAGERMQTAFGSTWSEAMAFALEVDAVPGDSTGIQPIWKMFATRSETDQLNSAAMKKSIGVPDEQIWAELGYSADEIKQFKAAKAEAAAQQAAQFATAFDRNQLPIGGK